MARLLIDYGANVNVMNSKGTPLHEAARKGHVGVARVLIAGGADVSLIDTQGKTWEDLTPNTSIRDTILGLSPNEDIPPMIIADGTLAETPENENGSHSLPTTALVEVDANEQTQEGQGGEMQEIHDSQDTKESDQTFPLLWPQPKFVQRREHFFSFANSFKVFVTTFPGDSTRITMDDQSALWLRLRQLICIDLGFQLARVQSQTICQGGDLILSIRSTLFHKPQSYRLTVKKECIVIVASDNVGLLYGVTTLCQLIRLYGS